MCRWCMWLDGAVVHWLDGDFFESFELCGLSALPGFGRSAREMETVSSSGDGAKFR